jgi:hypothetical protein
MNPFVLVPVMIILVVFAVGAALIGYLVYCVLNISRWLVELQLKDDWARVRALNHLTNMKPLNERRAEVLKALAPLQNDPFPQAKAAAGRAQKTWSQ